jgi:carbamate kinase
VVPSPVPREIVEVRAIRACLEAGLVVIAAGGGGVPVFNDKDVAKGVEAVIDKDLTSALLAAQIGADLLVIVTGEPYVYLDYGRPERRAVDRLTAVEARRHLQAGQFPEGSMGPKIQAALDFLARGGPRAVVTGRAGTHIVPGEPPRLS